MLDPSLPLRPSKDEATKPRRVKRSMYTIVTDNGDGYHLLYNTLTGRLLKLPSAEAVSAMKPFGEPVDAAALNGLQAHLFQEGFLVPEDSAEQRRSRMLYDERFGRRDRLELILLPHENCNFRCAYCYETFARNRMEPWVVESLKRFVESRAGEFRHLSISWFGGEPTLAVDVVQELSAAFIDICAEGDAGYSAGMTTNWFKGTPDVARTLVQDCKVSDFQITLDGPCKEHNKRRHLASGAGTYERIYANLLSLRDLEGPFEVLIRVNFDAANVAGLEGFTDSLAEDFAADGRFKIHFFPISDWGGEAVKNLPLCDSNLARIERLSLFDHAAEKGFRSLTREEIEPLGSVCYAADPNSFVVGADGTIYKCTVAFTDPRNQVGKMTAGGGMDIDIDRFGLWVVNDGVTDHGCQSCFFNPTCQGMTCPLYRIGTGDRPCPPTKTSFPDVIRLVAKELTLEMERQT